MLFYLPILLAAVCGVLYQVFLKTAPRAANPFLILTIAYAVSFSTCLIALIASRPKLLWAEAAKLGYLPWVLGFVIALFEVGMIFAYRMGWKMSLVSVSLSTLIGTSVILIGAFVFKEHLTPSSAAGLILCLVGLSLIYLVK